LEDSAVLLRLRTKRRITPREAPRLQRIVSRILPRSVLRAAGKRVEIVSFTKPSETQLEMLRKELGATMVEVLEPETGKWSDECLADPYARLLEENMFWEAHVLGEKIWRRGIPLGRHLAVLAGAYAKAQEGLLEAAKAVLRKALRSETLRELTDRECLERELERVYREGVGDVAKCIDVDRLRSLVCTDNKKS